MSLSRLALRLAAVEALCPAATIDAGPFPTMAGPRVYDSRIDLIDFALSPADLGAALTKLEGKPLLCVYTEEQATAPYGEMKYPAAENVVTLVVEALIGGIGEIVYEQPDGTTKTIGTLEAPVTDRQHEATLDVLEGQVRFLFDRRYRAPSSALFHKVAWELRSVHSDPQRAADHTVRLASRTLKFHIKVAQESWVTAPGTGFPEPLATVAAALPAGSSGAQICADLAAAAPVLTVIPAPLAGSGILIKAAVSRPPGTAATAPDLEAFIAPPGVSPPSAL